MVFSAFHAILFTWADGIDDRIVSRHPNAFTLLLAVVGFMLVQIQVRLEEEFLSKTHGENYLHYKSSVRRFI